MGVDAPEREGEHRLAVRPVRSARRCVISAAEPRLGLGEGVALEVPLVGGDAPPTRRARGSRGPTESAHAPPMFGVPASNLRRGLAERHPVGVHLADHLAAAHPGGHPVEELRSAPERPDPRGAEGLVAGEREQVDARARATSIGRWGADWAASTTTSAPAAWARSAISCTGLTVPSTLETWVNVTTRVAGVQRARRAGPSGADPSSSMSRNWRSIPMRLTGASATGRCSSGAPSPS